MESEGNRPPKFMILWFVAINMALAFSYDVIVYVGASGSSAWHGRLDEYKALHYCTMFGFVFTWLTFILVHRTDPGTLANKNYVSSNLPSTRGRNGNDAAAPTIFIEFILTSHRYIPQNKDFSYCDRFRQFTRTFEWHWIYYPFDVRMNAASEISNNNGKKATIIHCHCYSIKTLCLLSARIKTVLPSGILTCG